MLFLDPNRPLHTCTSGNCETCALKHKINCHFSLSQLVKFLIFAFPPFIFAGVVLFRIHPFIIFPYILLFFAYFGFIEIKVMCSHCPHYAEPDINSLKCWANYGIPKLWKYNPGPMTTAEKIIFFTGMIAVLIYPIFFLIFTHHLLFLVIYLILIIPGVILLNLFLCTQCMNFACPLNKVKKEVRDVFFEKNPSIKKAWKKSREDKTIL
jgi:hypothetical protein